MPRYIVEYGDKVYEYVHQGPKDVAQKEFLAKLKAKKGVKELPPQDRTTKWLAEAGDVYKADNLTSILKSPDKHDNPIYKAFYNLSQIEPTGQALTTTPDKKTAEPTQNTYTIRHGGLTYQYKHPGTKEQAQQDFIASLIMGRQPQPVNQPQYVARRKAEDEAARRQWLTALVTHNWPQMAQQEARAPWAIGQLTGQVTAVATKEPLAETTRYKPAQKGDYTYYGPAKVPLQPGTITRESRKLPIDVALQDKFGFDAAQQIIAQLQLPKSEQQLIAKRPDTEATKQEFIRRTGFTEPNPLAKWGLKPQEAERRVLFEDALARFRGETPIDRQVQQELGPIGQVPLFHKLLTSPAETAAERSLQFVLEQLTPKEFAFNILAGAGLAALPKKALAKVGPAVAGGISAAMATSAAQNIREGRVGPAIADIGIGAGIGVLPFAYPKAIAKLKDTVQKTPRAYTTLREYMPGEQVKHSVAVDAEGNVYFVTNRKPNGDFIGNLIDQDGKLGKWGPINTNLRVVASSDELLEAAKQVGLTPRKAAREFARRQYQQQQPATLGDTDAVQEQGPAQSVLRDQGLRREGELQGVGGKDQGRPTGTRPPGETTTQTPPVDIPIRPVTHKPTWRMLATRAEMHASEMRDKLAQARLKARADELKRRLFGDGDTEQPPPQTTPEQPPVTQPVTAPPQEVVPPQPDIPPPTPQTTDIQQPPRVLPRKKRAPAANQPIETVPLSQEQVQPAPVTPETVRVKPRQRLQAPAATQADVPPAGVEPPPPIVEQPQPKPGRGPQAPDNLARLAASLISAAFDVAGAKVGAVKARTKAALAHIAPFATDDVIEAAVKKGFEYQTKTGLTKTRSQVLSDMSVRLQNAAQEGGPPGTPAPTIDDIVDDYFDKDLLTAYRNLQENPTSRAAKTRLEDILRTMAHAYSFIASPDVKPEEIVELIANRYQKATNLHYRNVSQPVTIGGASFDNTMRQAMLEYMRTEYLPTIYNEYNPHLGLRARQIGINAVRNREIRQLLASIGQPPAKQVKNMKYSEIAAEVDRAFGEIPNRAIDAAKNVLAGKDISMKEMMAVQAYWRKSAQDLEAKRALMQAMKRRGEDTAAIEQELRQLELDVTLYGQASDRIGQMWSKLGRSRQMILDPEQLIIIRLMDAMKGPDDELSPDTVSKIVQLAHREAVITQVRQQVLDEKIEAAIDSTFMRRYWQAVKVAETKAEQMLAMEELRRIWSKRLPNDKLTAGVDPVIIYETARRLALSAPVLARLGKASGKNAFNQMLAIIDKYYPALKAIDARKYLTEDVFARMLEIGPDKIKRTLAHELATEIRIRQLAAQHAEAGARLEAVEQAIADAGLYQNIGTTSMKTGKYSAPQLIRTVAKLLRFEDRLLAEMANATPERAHEMLVELVGTRRRRIKDQVARLVRPSHVKEIVRLATASDDTAFVELMKSQKAAYELWLRRWVNEDLLPMARKRPAFGEAERLTPTKTALITEEAYIKLVDEYEETASQLAAARQKLQELQRTVEAGQAVERPTAPSRKRTDQDKMATPEQLEQLMRTIATLNQEHDATGGQKVLFESLFGFNETDMPEHLKTSGIVSLMKRLVQEIYKFNIGEYIKPKPPAQPGDMPDSMADMTREEAVQFLRQMLYEVMTASRAMGQSAAAIDAAMAAKEPPAGIDVSMFRMAVDLFKKQARKVEKWMYENTKYQELTEAAGGPTWWKDKPEPKPRLEDVERAREMEALLRGELEADVNAWYEFYDALRNRNQAFQNVHRIMKRVETEIEPAIEAAKRRIAQGEEPELPPTKTRPKRDLTELEEQAYEILNARLKELDELLAGVKQKQASDRRIQALKDRIERLRLAISDPDKYPLEPRRKVQRYVTEEEKFLREEALRLAGQYEALMRLRKPEQPMDWLDRYGRLNLLSNPATHLLNFIGTGINAARLEATRAAELLMARDAPAAAARVHGYVVGTRKGIVSALEIMARGYVPSHLSEGIVPVREFRGGPANPYNIIGRVMRASDIFWFETTRHAELYALARAKANNEQELIELMLNPPPALVRAADRHAMEVCFRVGHGKDTLSSRFVTWVDMGARYSPAIALPIKFLEPFYKVGMEITRQGVNLMPGVRIGQLMYHRDTTKVPRAVADTAVGLMMATYGASLYFSGGITAGPQRKELQKNQWLHSNAGPYMFRLGDRWTNAAYLGPLAVPMYMGAALAEGYERTGKMPDEETLRKLVKVSQNTLIGSLKGISQSSPVSNLSMTGQYLSGEATSKVTQLPASLIKRHIPFVSFLNLLSKTIDDTVRDPQRDDLYEIWQELANSMPVISQELPPRQGARVPDDTPKGRFISGITRTRPYEGYGHERFEIVEEKAQPSMPIKKMQPVPPFDVIERLREGLKLPLNKFELPKIVPGMR